MIYPLPVNEIKKSKSMIPQYSGSHHQRYQSISEQRIRQARQSK